MIVRPLNRVASLFFAIASIGTIGSLLFASGDNKVPPSELIQKHLASIGTEGARSQIQNTRIKGTFVLVVREGGTGQAEGKAIMASQRDMNLIQLNYSADDPSTWLKFDGSKVSVSQFRPGRHTSLEHFFAAYEGIIREGLVGGTLSQSWPLMNVTARNPKLEYVGTKKIDGKEMHALKYTPRNGSDLKITLFFATDTFQHMRTTYEQTIYSTEQQRIAGGGGRLPGVSARRASPTRLTAFEEFSDFRSEQGLMLPHTYKFELSIQSETRPTLIDWVVTLTDFSFNAPIDEFKGN